MSAKLKEIRALLSRFSQDNRITAEAMLELAHEILAREEALKRRLRDDFARSAMPALIEQFDTVDMPWVAGRAYEAADAMLEARKQ